MLNPSSIIGLEDQQQLSSSKTQAAELRVSNEARLPKSSSSELNGSTPYEVLIAASFLVSAVAGVVIATATLIKVIVPVMLLTKKKR